jgi:hypothetical protein
MSENKETLQTANPKSDTENKSLNKNNKPEKKDHHSGNSNSKRNLIVAVAVALIVLLVVCCLSLFFLSGELIDQLDESGDDSSETVSESSEDSAESDEEIEEETTAEVETVKYFVNCRFYEYDGETMTEFTSEIEGYEVKDNCGGSEVIDGDNFLFSQFETTSREIVRKNYHLRVTERELIDINSNFVGDIAFNPETNNYYSFNPGDGVVTKATSATGELSTIIDYPGEVLGRGIGILDNVSIHVNPTGEYLLVNDSYGKFEPGAGNVSRDIAIIDLETEEITKVLDGSNAIWVSDYEIGYVTISVTGGEPSEGNTVNTYDISSDNVSTLAAEDTMPVSMRVEGEELWINSAVFAEDRYELYSIDLNTGESEILLDKIYKPVRFDETTIIGMNLEKCVDVFSGEISREEVRERGALGCPADGSTDLYTNRFISVTVEDGEALVSEIREIEATFAG